MITPLGRRVLVKPEEKETVSKGGIILTPDSIEQASEGTIIELSDELSEDPLNSLFRGDVVIYNRYSPTEVIDEDDKYLIIDAEDIIGTIS